MMASTQASLEYGGSAVREMLRWSSQAFQDHWYYVVGIAVAVVVLWGYLRK